MKSNLATVEFNESKIEEILAENKKRVCAEAILACYSVANEGGSTRLYIQNGDFQNTYTCAFRFAGRFTVSTAETYGNRLSKKDAIIDGINELERVLTTNGGKIEELCMTKE